MRSGRGAESLPLCGCVVRLRPTDSLRTNQKGWTSMDGLKNKVAIVTGGATLIGAEVVRAFHGAGTKVVIADINAKDGEAIAKALGANVLFVQTDLAEDKQIAGCVEKTVKAFGGV